MQLTINNNNNNKGKIFYTGVIFISCLLFFTSLHANAQSTIEVRPQIIDEKGYPRDIITRTISVTNKTSAIHNLYLVVEDIDGLSGDESFERVQGNELSDTLANWTKIKRHIELEPNSAEEIELTFHINLTAEPGIYHAVLRFYEGPNRARAESRRALEEVLLNFEVLDNTKEVAQLTSFRPARTFFSGFPVELEYEFENIGNTDLTPSGEIIIYNRRGREVSSVAVAPGSINAQDSAAFAVKWQNNSKGAGSALASIGNGVANLGKYKAVIRMQYGNKAPGTLQDTVYFWIIPWQFLLAIFITLGGLIIFSVHKFHGARYQRFPEEKYTIDLTIEDHDE